MAIKLTIVLCLSIQGMEGTGKSTELVSLQKTDFYPAHVEKLVHGSTVFSPYPTVLIHVSKSAVLLCLYSGGNRNISPVISLKASTLQ